VIMAHFDELAKHTPEPNEVNTRDYGFEVPGRVHTGVAVVAPVRFVRDLIYCEELVEMRRKLDEVTADAAEQD
jgi:hypothetical protein